MTSNYIPTKELLEKKNITMNTVLARMKRGWTFEDAITIPPRKMIKCEMPLYALAVEYGINYYTLRYRIDKMGMSLDEALNLPPRPRRKYNFDVKQAAKDIGISEPTIYQRLRDGWTLNEISKKYKIREENDDSTSD